MFHGIWLPIAPNLTTPANTFHRPDPPTAEDDARAIREMLGVHRRDPADIDAGDD